MSKIAILSNKLINYSLTKNIHITNKIGLVETVEKELLELFQTYRNTDSAAVEQKDDNFIHEQELRSEIKSLLSGIKIKFEYAENSPEYNAGYHTISGLNKVTKELLELFKTHQNSVLRPVNNKDEQVIN